MAQLHYKRPSSSAILGDKGAYSALDRERRLADHYGFIINALRTCGPTVRQAFWRRPNPASLRLREQTLMLVAGPLRAVVFDMDGLLVDTERLYLDACRAAAADRETTLPDDIFLQMLGKNRQDSHAVLLDHFGAGFDVDNYWNASSDHFRLMAQSGIALKSGVLELLAILDERALPRAIATSSPRENVAQALGPHGLLDRFQVIVAKGDYARGKPAPDPFLVAAHKLGVAPEACLALEDSHNGVRAAATAGMMTVMVPDLLEPNEDMRSLCFRIARDLHEVCDLVNGQSSPA